MIIVTYCYHVLELFVRRQGLFPRAALNGIRCYMRGSCSPNPSRDMKGVLGIRWWCFTCPCMTLIKVLFGPPQAGIWEQGLCWPGIGPSCCNCSEKCTCTAVTPGVTGHAICGSWWARRFVLAFGEPLGGCCCGCWLCGRQDIRNPGQVSLWAS